MDDVLLPGWTRRLGVLIRKGPAARCFSTSSFAAPRGLGQRQLAPERRLGHAPGAASHAPWQVRHHRSRSACRDWSLRISVLERMLKCRCCLRSSVALLIFALGATEMSGASVDLTARSTRSALVKECRPPGNCLNTALKWHSRLSWAKSLKHYERPSRFRKISRRLK